MVTFFTLPKPFNDQYYSIQRNAIKSWKTIIPECQILVFSDSDGDEESIRDLGVEWIRDTRTNDFGTPFLDHVFLEVHAKAKFELICYVNTDIIFLPDFVKSIQCIRKKHYLMIGCRYDIDVQGDIEISQESEGYFKTHAIRAWKNDALYGSDYFLFTKSSGLREIPNFLVGRPGWDNWLIYRARTLHLPVIDASLSVFCVHQNHDYLHVPKRTGKKWEGVEADHNLSLFTKQERFSLVDATHRLENGKLRFKFSKQVCLRYLSTLQVTHPGLMPLFRFYWFLGRLKNHMFSARKPSI